MAQVNSTDRQKLMEIPIHTEVEMFTQHLDSLIESKVIVGWPVDDSTSGIYVYPYCFSENTHYKNEIPSRNMQQEPSSSIHADLHLNIHLLLMSNPADNLALLGVAMRELYKNPIIANESTKLRITLCPFNISEVYTMFLAKKEPHRLFALYQLES